MAKPKVQEDVAASIQRSIEVSPRGSRRVRCHSLRDLFGFQAWTAPRKKLVASLLQSRGIRAQPSISKAGLRDWIILSLPVLPPPDDSNPDPRPSEEWCSNHSSEGRGSGLESSGGGSTGKLRMIQSRSPALLIDGCARMPRLCSRLATSFLRGAVQA